MDYVNDDCDALGPLVFTILNKTDVHTPNYPVQYYNGEHCTWKFLAVDEFRIRLKIDEEGWLEEEYAMLISKLNY